MRNQTQRVGTVLAEASVFTTNKTSQRKAAPTSNTLKLPPTEPKRPGLSQKHSST
jgi:hypothetical protein